MFGADLTEPGVLSHVHPSFKAELFGTLYDRHSKHLPIPSTFVVDTVSAARMPQNPQAGSFLPQSLRFPVAKFEADTPPHYCLPI